MTPFIAIDGAHGEGGGQVVRTAVAVSAATGVALDGPDGGHCPRGTGVLVSVGPRR